MNDPGDGRERNEERSEAPAAGKVEPGGESPEGDRRESGSGHSSAAPGGGLFGLRRTIEVEGVQHPVASLLRRGTALAVDLFFGLLVVAIAIDVISYFVPLDTDRATGPMIAAFGLLALHILWLRDRGASRPGGGLRFGLSVGRWLLGLRLVPVAGPRRFTRPVTVAGAARTEGETMRIVRAVLLGVAASFVALMLLGHALSRTLVFRAVQDHVAQHAPLAVERGTAPELAGVPSALLVGQSRTRAYVRVDAEWGERGDPLEFFLVRNAGEWRVAEVRIGESGWLPDYALSAPDAEVPTP